MAESSRLLNNDPMIARAGISVESFLCQDFYEAGFREGSLNGPGMPSPTKIRVLQETFRFRLDLAIERQRIMLEELVRQRLDGKLTNVQTRELEEAEITVLGIIDCLEEQKALAAHGEGWIAGPLQAYREGFHEGATQT